MYEAEAIASSGSFNLLPLVNKKMERCLLNRYHFRPKSNIPTSKINPVRLNMLGESLQQSVVAASAVAAIFNPEDNEIHLLTTLNTQVETIVC